MAGGKESPRQKMIGMMYLVLTAMLALNVSVEILKSFIIVNDSVEKTAANFARKVESLYVMFEKSYTANPPKMEDSWQKAQKARQMSQELRDFVTECKYGLIVASEKVTLEEAKVMDPRAFKRQDNYDDPTNYFIGQSEDGSGGKARELREKIDAYREAMLALLPAESLPHVNIGLDTKGPFYDAAGTQQSWEIQNFYHTIICADVAILNNLQSAILNAEYDIVSELYASVSSDDFKFDNVVARVVPKSTYVMVGDNFEAEIFVAAFDSKSKITATIGGQTIGGDSGKVVLKRLASTEGSQTLTGVINVPGAFGTKTFPFTTQYFVARPSSTVSADKMNVFYVGLDNPVSIAASGVRSEDIEPVISNGNITRSGKAGAFTVRVNTIGKATITINVRSGKGVQSMGSYEFRVKRVPDPVPLVNGMSEGENKTDRNVLANAGGIVANMKDFDFDVRVAISSFTMQTSKGGELSPLLSSSGNKFTDDMVSLIKSGKRGQKVFFENIQAKMPDGTTRTLPPIVITLM